MSYEILLAIVVVVLWAACCIKKINPDEMGIKVFFGKPGKVVDSGPAWVWWPLEKLERYTKNVLTFEFVVPSVMTRRGKVPGYDQIVETAEVDLHCTIQAYFDKDKLQRTLEHAPGTTENDLGPELVPYVIDIIRALGGRVPWRLINEERRAFVLNILHRIIETKDPVPELDISDEEVPTFRFKDRQKDGEHFCLLPLSEEDLEDDSPFVQFGLKSVSVMIRDVDFTDPELGKAISEPEKARLKAIATKRTAEAENYRLQQEGQGAAKARDMMIKVIENKPELEVLMTLREMAQGTSNTIMYQVPPALDHKMRELLGGNAPGDIARMLRPEDQAWLQQVIDEAIRKLADASKGGR